MIWAEYDAVITQTATPQLITVDLLAPFKAATGSTVAKATVMRTHGYITVTSGSSAGSRFWHGIRVYDLDDITNAMAAPITTIANPRDNPFTDWASMSRHSFDQSTSVHPAAIGGNDASPGAGVTFDIKSRRRLDNVQDTWGLCLLGDTGMAATSSYQVFFRTLLALP